MKVEFELRISAFGDDIMQLPAEVIQDVHQLAEKAHRVDRVFDIVAECLAPWSQTFAFGGVVIEGLDRPAVFIPLHGDKFGFDAGHHRVTLVGGVTDHALQRLARAKIIGFAFPPKVCKHPGAGRIPGADH